MTNLLKDLAEMVGLCDRLDQLAVAAAEQRWNEFSMRVPVEPKRDADVVLSTVARIIRAHAAEIEADKRDAELWNALCADCDRLDSTSDQTPINIVTDACFLGSGALERHYDAAMRSAKGGGE